MSQTRSSCRAWYCGCCRRAACNVTGVVVVPLSVLRLLSSRHAWCCRRCRRAALSVAVAFVTPRVVSRALFVGLRGVVVVTILRVVSLLSRHVVLRSQSRSVHPEESKEWPQLSRGSASEGHQGYDELYSLSGHTGFKRTFKSHKPCRDDTHTHACCLGCNRHTTCGAAVTVVAQRGATDVGPRRGEENVKRCVEGCRDAKARQSASAGCRGRSYASAGSRALWAP